MPHLPQLHRKENKHAAKSCVCHSASLSNVPKHCEAPSRAASNSSPAHSLHRVSSAAAVAPAARSPSAAVMRADLSVRSFGRPLPDTSSATECGNKGKRRALNVMAGVMCPPAWAADAAAQCAPLSRLRWFSHRIRFAIRRLFLADGRDSASHRLHRVSVPCWSVTGEQRSGLGQRHGEKTGRAGGYMRRPASFAGGAGSSWEAGSRRRTSA